jgi:hypothetical protein
MNRRLLLSALLAATIVPGVACATEFWEVRLSAGLLGGRDRFQYDLIAGAGFDTYITSDIGALLALDAGFLAHADGSAEPSDLLLTPELSVWFGEDASRQRPFLTLRPVFGIVDLDGDGLSVFERFELGPQYGLQTETGGVRARAGVFWTPSFTQNDDRFELLSGVLRVTFAFAPPARLPPPPPDSCLPCAPGCPCPP